MVWFSIRRQGHIGSSQYSTSRNSRSNCPCGRGNLSNFRRSYRPHTFDPFFSSSPLFPLNSTLYRTQIRPRTAEIGLTGYQHWQRLSPVRSNSFQLKNIPIMHRSSLCEADVGWKPLAPPLFPVVTFRRTTSAFSNALQSRNPPKHPSRMF